MSSRGVRPLLCRYLLTTIAGHTCPQGCGHSVCLVPFLISLMLFSPKQASREPHPDSLGTARMRRRGLAERRAKDPRSGAVAGPGQASQVWASSLVPHVANPRLQRHGRHGAPVLAMSLHGRLGPERPFFPDFLTFGGSRRSRHCWKVRPKPTWRRNLRTLGPFHRPPSVSQRCGRMGWSRGGRHDTRRPSQPCASTPSVAFPGPFHRSDSEDGP